jgi:hypothetical protein
VGVVHGLESDAGVIAVEVAVLDEVLDGVDDLAATVSILFVVGLGTPYHIRASEGWPVPNELPTLERRSIDLFFAQKNLFDLKLADLLLSVFVCFEGRKRKM